MALTKRSGAIDASLDDASAEEFSTRVAQVVPVMSLLASRFAGRTERDDVVQDALMNAWAKRHQFNPARGTLRAWLLAITANAARRRRRETPARSGRVDVTGPDPDARLDVERAMQSLTPRERLAVDCFYFAGLSVDETAAVMACSAGTVKSTLSSARGRLRALLEVSK
jgi:RNA polymerase sigma-70 factor (ECF subfamily)